MHLKRYLVGAGLAAFLSAASATITFDELTNSDYYVAVNPVTTQGYTFSNNCFVGADCLGVWNTSGAETMDPGGAAVFVNYANTITKMTSSAGTFDFYSIDLADVYNRGESVTIAFTFQYAAGGSSTTSVTLDEQVGGETFAFNQTGLSSVSWVTTGGANGWNQFDNVNVTPVPEPAALAMMLAGLGAVGIAARRRRG